MLLVHQLYIYAIAHSYFHPQQEGPKSHNVNVYMRGNSLIPRPFINAGYETRGVMSCNSDQIQQVRNNF